jgi:hypothetical protein
MSHRSVGFVGAPVLLLVSVVLVDLEEAEVAETQNPRGRFAW